MFDQLRNQYALHCTTHAEQTWVPVSAFRRIRRLRGATSPAVFRVQFDCACGDATEQMRKGRWPWTFWCHPESAVRPGFPSSLRFVTPEHDHGNERVGVLVRCFTCERHTVNIVSREHLDVPWHNDPAIAYVAQLFDGDQIAPEERFRHQLWDGFTRQEWLDAG
jgi:hypothetical protein